jgi:hypothetical protein
MKSLLLILGFLLFPPALQPDWQLILLDRSEGAVYRVSPQGVELISLSAAPVTLAVSVDGQFLAFADEARNVHVANLQTGACCVTFAIPTEANREIVDTGVGAISPDGRQVALYSVFTTAQGAPFDGEVVVVNAMDGSIAARKPMNEISARPGLVNPLFGTWQAEGIELFPACFACDAFFDGHYIVWNPAADTLSTSKYGPGGAYLELTGEEVRLNRSEDYPLGPEVMFGPFNVLEYASGAEFSLVYVEPGNTDLGWPAWVADGQAVLLHKSDDTKSSLVFRNGQSQHVEYPGSARFLAGTPSGWVVALTETGDVYAYEVNNGALSVLPIGKIPNPDESWAVYRPPLGTNATPGFVFSEGRYEATVCPGFLPSRLTIGQPGRVTPGPANNLRAEPSIQSQKIGQIPGSGEFMVVDGPVCTPGMAWWQVEYNGIIGWTGEGQDDTYWLEPVN